jgi:Xaa-Pro dipeptidase
MSAIAESLREAGHRERMLRLRERMAETGVDLVIAYAWGNHSYLDFNPVWYLTGLKQIGPHAALVVPETGEPRLLMTPRFDLERAQERVHDADVIASDAFTAAEFAELVRRHLPGLGADSEVALVSGEDPPLSDPAAWTSALGRPVTALPELLLEIAKTRDDLQLALIARATEIAEDAHEHMLASARPGISEHQLLAAVDARMRSLGADDAFLLMSSSLHNHCVHWATERTLEAGDIVLAEISPSVDGEFVQICRSFVLGREPSEAERESFALLDLCFHEGIREAHAGAQVDAVVRAINGPLIEAGYERYIVPPYMRTRGHANGMGAPIPELRPGDRTELLERMTFELHPNQYIPEVGYLMCGEPVIVERAAARPLTSKVGSLDWVS